MSTLFKDFFPGLYEGIVEYINDPAQMGRIKARVPVIDGQTRVKTECLPWAMPCVPFGGGPGFGTISVPPEGSTVYIIFKHGDSQKPIYLGSFFGNPGQETRMLTNNEETFPPGKVSMAKEDEFWLAPPGPDAPKEFLIQSDNRPERSIIFKTVKGASLDINERDEDERLALHDRSGQSLVFESNISEESNDQNKSARELKSAFEGNALAINNTLTNEGSIDLVDIGGQSVSLHTKEKNNKILLTSKEVDITKSFQKEIDGTSTVSLELSGGNKKVIIEIKDKAQVKAKILLDGNTESLEILSPSLVKINAKNIILTGNVTIDGDLIVTKNTYQLNDKID